MSKNGGLYVVIADEKPWRLSDYLEVKGFAHEDGNEEYLALIGFHNLNGEKRELVVKRSDLRRTDTVLQQLTDHGFDIPDNFSMEHYIAEYLRSARPQRRYILSPRTGWFDDRFIFNDKIIGSGGRPIRYLPPIRRDGLHASTGGTLSAWKEGVAAPAAHSSRMVLAIGTAFAAALLKHTRVESGAFHLFSNRSSRGKTTALIAAQSVQGWCHRKDLLHWNVTDTGLEEVAVEHCDQLLVLDEIAQLSDDESTAAAKARKAAFKLSGGSGRIRSKHFGNKGNLCDWRLLMLSSGETSISQLADAAGRSRLAGEQVRLIDVPAVVNEKYGVFETIPRGYRDANALVQEIEKACESNFGLASREFVVRLIEDMPKSLKLVDYWREEFDEFAETPANGWERRFASRFGLVYAASRLARRFGIVGWNKGRIRQAILSCYKAARQSIPNREELIAEALGAIRRLIRDGRTLRDLRAGRSAAGQPELDEFDGFVLRHERHGTYFAIRRSAFESCIGDRVSAREIANLLLDAGHLITTSRDSFTRQVKVAGVKRKRSYVCIRRSFLKDARAVG